jgi:gamma-glutamyltranspeptidase/glutathione hydrolase
MFALYYDAQTKQVTALNGSGRAPAALTLDRLKKEGLLAESLPLFHAHTMTVPGACAGWCDLIEKHGSLSMGDIPRTFDLRKKGSCCADHYFWAPVWTGS